MKRHEAEKKASESCERGQVVRSNFERFWISGNFRDQQHTSFDAITMDDKVVGVLGECLSPLLAARKVEREERVGGRRLNRPSS
jgi:hypothetical protein